eukprot:45397-Eustigmatos_ZCMA.PRE.1
MRTEPTAPSHSHLCGECCTLPLMPCSDFTAVARRSVDMLFQSSPQRLDAVTSLASVVKSPAVLPRL